MNMHLTNQIKAIVQSMLSLQGQPKFAIVSTAPNPADATCKVQIMPDMALLDRNGQPLETGYLPIGCMAAGPLHVMALPSVGDQVLVLPDTGDAEHGVVIAGVHSTKNPPPISPVTGKPAQPGEYLVYVGGVYFHIANGNVYVGGGNLILNGNLQVTGNITSTGEITAGEGGGDQVSLQTLKVQGVQTGSGDSGEPEPGS